MENALQPPVVTAIANGFLLHKRDNTQTFHRGFRHMPLSGRRTIRLITLISERHQSSHSPGANINESGIVERSLDDEGLKYVTLSYAWGGQDQSAPFLVDEGQHTTILPITPNAWEAINLVVPSLILPSGEKPLFWIDQICINQTDNDEKREQVKLMGDIYRRGWCCCVWLGPSAPDTGAAYMLLEEIERTFPHNRPMTIQPRELAVLTHQQIRSRLAAVYGQDRLPAQTHQGWPAFCKLLGRDWFLRLWTFQEVVLSFKGDATVMCGRYHVPIITVMRAAVLVGQDFAFGIDYGNGRATMSRASEFRHAVELGRPTPMIHLLQQNDFYQCSLPHDRIYAMLGMRKEDPNMPLEPIHVDYGISARDLYIDTCRKIIRSQHSLRICAAAPERQAQGQVAELPSWVPDWTSPAITVAHEWLDARNPYFKADRHRPHLDTGNGDILQVRGRILDTIEEMTSVEAPPRTSTTLLQTYLRDELLPVLAATLTSLSRSLTVAQQFHVIIKTITLSGYTRVCNTGTFNLPDNAWDESTCLHMMHRILGLPTANQGVNLTFDDWLAALAAQALACVNRRFVILKNNPLALVPAGAQEKDSIAILHGSTLPHVLRRDGHYYKMIGTCFVDGMMYGERTLWTENEFDTFQIA